MSTNILVIAVQQKSRTKWHTWWCSLGRCHTHICAGLGGRDMRHRWSRAHICAGLSGRDMRHRWRRVHICAGLGRRALAMRHVGRRALARSCACHPTDLTPQTRPPDCRPLPCMLSAIGRRRTIRIRRGALDLYPCSPCTRTCDAHAHVAY